MSDAWKDRERAKEEEFFERQNKEALKKISHIHDDSKERLSPLTGKPMKKTSVKGVSVYTCPEVGGVWIEHGGFEQLMRATMKGSEGSDWLFQFLTEVFEKKQ